MPKKKYNEEYIIKVYELSKSGHSKSKISKALGINSSTLSDWIKRKKAFRIAMKKGRQIYKKRFNGKEVTFFEYVHSRLSKKYRKLWNKINKIDEAGTGIEKIDAMLEKRGQRVRQHMFLHAWVSGNFMIGVALRKTCTSYRTFRRWRDEDPHFAELLDEMIWHRKNFYEDSLCQSISAGDTASIIFSNRTYNKDRGYQEKTDVNVNVTGEVSHVARVDDLNLPLETRKQLLKAVRKVRQVESKIIDIPKVEVER